MSYQISYNNHIRMRLAALPLKAVRPVHVQGVMNDIAKMSEDLQRKVLNTMKQLFNTAIQNRLMALNPCEGIKITKHDDGGTHKFLDDLQQEELLEAVKGTRAELFVTIGLLCGLRREETFGLMWSDIDFDKYELHINGTLTFLKTSPIPTMNLKAKLRIEQFLSLKGFLTYSQLPGLPEREIMIICQDYTGFKIQTVAKGQSWFTGECRDKLLLR